MSKGIYCYIDKKDNQIVYVGKDSYIDKNKRHKEHLAPSSYNKQQINRILQNNPDRYIYQVLWEINDCSDNHKNQMEIFYIKKYNPKFNFTEGGDRASGFKHSLETRKKMSEARNTTGFYRIFKKKDNNCKQGFVWAYKYYDNNKPKTISSTDLKRLKKKIEAQGLSWEIIDKDNAKKSLVENERCLNE